jgi:hypothetical protein
MTSQSVKPFTGVLRPRREVQEGEVVEALSLADIYIYNELGGRVPGVPELRPNPLYNPEDFLRRTYFSEAMRQAILKVFGGLAGVSHLYLDDRGSRLPITSRVVIVPSYLGGGKTHLLATLYHIAKLVRERGEEALRYLEGDDRFRHAMKHAVKVIKDRGGLQVVAIVGDRRTLAPSPDSPLELGGYRIHTPWGLLGYLLGAYEVVKAADEGRYAPRVDELRKLLQGRSVLILIDEAVEYMELAVSLDSKFRGYSNSFQSFLRNLAEAVSESPGAVLVLTLPAEYREGTLVPGLQHPEYVERIRAVLGRVAHEYIPPLEFRRDVVEVFKKRLFENAYSSEVQELARSVAQEVESRAQRDSTLATAIKLRYGDIYDFRRRVQDSYPFHPCFVEVLVNIASANPQLGLTRYLLAYVARLVRYIYETRERLRRDPPVALITTWVIPTTRVEFRAELLGGMLAQQQNEFQRIYEQDVKPHAVKLENLLWSAETLSKQSLYDFVRGAVSWTVWLYTLPGRGGKTEDIVRLYPKLQELPVIVYDPLAFQNVVAADVVNAINDLLNVSTYLTKTSDGRVFYVRIPEIEKLLRERYVEATDLDALIMLERLVGAGSLKPGRKIKHVDSIRTDKVMVIEDQLKGVLAKTQNPVLFVYLALSEPPTDLEDVVLVRNNVVLLKPDYGENPLERGLVYSESIKRVVGSEPTTMRDYIRSLLKFLKVVNDLLTKTEYLREAFGEEYLTAVVDRLKRLRDDAEKQVATAIFSCLRKVVLGLQRVTYEVDLRPSDEEVKDLSSLARLLEEFLERRGVLTSWTWVDIYNQLKEWDVWDLDTSPKRPIRVGDIWDQLLSSPSVRPHVTGYEDFMEALKKAYNENLIAFRYSDRILWLRHPYSIQEVEQYYKVGYRREGRLNDWGRDVEQVAKALGVRLSDLEVVSPRLVVRDLVNRLRKYAAVKPGERVVRRLVVHLPDAKQDFTAFIARFKSDVDLADALSRYPVVVEEETPSRVFNLVVTRVNERVYASVGEVVEVEGEGLAVVRVEGRVDAEEVFPVVITLKAVDGSGNVVARTDVEMKVPASFQLELKLSNVGEYTVFITAREPGGYRVDEVPVARVRVRGELCVDRVYGATELARVLQTVGGATRVEVRTVQLKGVVRKYAIPSLSELLALLGKYGTRVTGRISLKGGTEEIRVEFRNASTSKIAKFVGSLGVEEDLEIEVEFPEAIGSLLDRDRAVRAKLTDPSSPLSTLVQVSLRVCSRV